MKQQSEAQWPRRVQSSGRHSHLWAAGVQVAALMRQHPGIMLLIEVGYKMRLFGDDAEAAAHVLHIFAYQDRNYLTASKKRPAMEIHDLVADQAALRYVVHSCTCMPVLSTSDPETGLSLCRSAGASPRRACAKACQRGLQGGPTACLHCFRLKSD